MQNKRHILEDIKLDINEETFLKRAMVKPGTAVADMAMDFLNGAGDIARPAALYISAYIDEREGDDIVIAGTRFTSRILSINLKESNRVFPFAATCGTEIENWSHDLNDPLESYWAEALKGVALETAIDAIRADIERNYKPGKISLMNPGSLENWPIEQQKILFDLLGDTEKTIGLQLTETLVMQPVMSLSGIMFPSEINFYSCRLCPREKCPGRRAKFDQRLYDEMM